MNRIDNTRRLLLAGLGGLAAAAVTGARAQGAGKPLRIIVPYPPGGTQDAMMRQIQDPLGKLLGQPVVIENRAGAAGMIGAQVVKQSTPDGSTLLLFNNGMVITPLIQRSTPFDFAKDMVAVSTVGVGPMVIFVNGDVPVNDIKSLIALAKSKPGGLSFASSGMGGLGHLTMEAFENQADIKLTHVPYKGNAPLMLAVLSGETPVGIGTVSDTMLQSVRAGKLKTLGITTRQLSPAVPGVPPVADTMKPFDFGVTFAMLAPPGTPAKIVQDQHDAFVKVLDQPEVRERYLSYGLVARSGSPKDVTDMIDRELTQWKATVQSAHIQVEG